jgi:murein L,D-transpeptidase YcbB/YkuD
VKPWIQAAVLPLLLVWGCGNDPGSSASPGGLQAAVGNSPARGFYQRYGWRAVWSGKAEKELRNALEDRARHGLDRVRFLPDDPGSGAKKEAALTRAALVYASALAEGLVDPKSHYDKYTLPRPAPDLAAGLHQALGDGDLRSWLESLPPHDPEYEALSRAYLRLRDAGDRRPGASIPQGQLIHPGDRDPRVPRIAQALARDGYLEEPSSAAPSQQAEAADDLYGARISDAVRQLQQDRELRADGVVGPDTIEALNEGDDDRARAAAVALERRRWLQRNPPATRIDVNTASAMLTYIRDGEAVDRRRVIVGRPDWKTPQLQAWFYRLVANPTWTVPKSIERRQLGDVDSSYLKSHNMVRRNGFLVQLSGPDNALGLVKFDLDDDYAIYLHDTPSKALFDLNQRQFSHGCVRVQDALGIAAMIAADEGISQQWQAASAKGDETFVPLPRKIAVRLLYHPTWVDPSGRVRFGPDVYDQNDWIAQRLGFRESAAERFTPEGEDIGP